MKDLLQPRPFSVSIGITTKCNLRCSYCHKADPVLEQRPVANMDMDAETIGKLYRYCKDHNVRRVTLSTGGETTFRSDWIACVTPFVDDPDIHTFMVTNFARVLSDEELSVLARFDALQVSFDSADLEMVRALRSKADLRTIGYNISRLKQRGREIGRTPDLQVNCTLCRSNIDHVGKLAGYCLQLGVDTLLITEEMVIREGFNDQPDTIDKLNEEEILVLAKSIMEAQDVLAGTSTKFVMQQKLDIRVADVIQRLRSQAKPDTDGFHWVPRRVSACHMPWQSPMVQPDGSVTPCCGAGERSIGNLKLESMAEIVNGPAARAIRQSILDGKPIVKCAGCTLARESTFAEFKAEIETWFNDEAAHPAA